MAMTTIDRHPIAMSGARRRSEDFRPPLAMVEEGSFLTVIFAKPTMLRCDLGFTRDRQYKCASRVNPTCDLGFTRDRQYKCASRVNPTCDLGFTRDRQLELPKSAIADLGA